MGISIIVSAYRSAEFIEACLKSIDAQKYLTTHRKYEILLGIDNCEETLKKVQEIKDIANLRVFMMKENYGTYVVCNTLIDNAKYDYILRFDSDDMMKQSMVGSLVEQKADIVVMRYTILSGRRFMNPIRFSWGQALFKKEVFDVCGGYEPWRCAADKDLLSRASQKFKITRLDERLFYKRRHGKALTKAKDTGKNSELRKDAHRKMKHNINNQILKIERVTGDYEIV